MKQILSIKSFFDDSDYIHSYLFTPSISPASLYIYYPPSPFELERGESGKVVRVTDGAELSPDEFLLGDDVDTVTLYDDPEEKFELACRLQGYCAHCERIGQADTDRWCGWVARFSGSKRPRMTPNGGCWSVGGRSRQD